MEGFNPRGSDPFILKGSLKARRISEGNNGAKGMKLLAPGQAFQNVELKRSSIESINPVSSTDNFASVI